MEKASDLLSRLEEQSKQVRERIAKVHQSELASLEQSLKDLTSDVRRTIESDMEGQLGVLREAIEKKLGGVVERIESYRAEAQTKGEAVQAQMKRYWWERLLIGCLIYLGIFAGLWVPMQSLSRKVLDRVDQLNTLDRQIQEAEKTAGQVKYSIDGEGLKWVRVTIPSGQIVHSGDGKTWVEIGAAPSAGIWRGRQGKLWAQLEE